MNIKSAGTVGTSTNWWGGGGVALGLKMGCLEYFVLVVKYFM